MNIYEFAENTEKSGARFYREMAERTDQEGVKHIFSMLADDEEQLLEKLRLMRRRYPEMDSQASRYLREKDNVFENMRSREDEFDISSDVEAYRLARDAERQVLRQYLRAARAEKSSDKRKSLEWIAALERSELREIEKAFDFVDAPNHFLEWGEFSNLDEFHNFGRYEDR